MKTAQLHLLLLLLTYQGLTAGELSLDTPLKKLDVQFGLADGPAFDGTWALYIPDVKGQTLTRFVPRTNKATIIDKKFGRVSASYFNHGKLYLSDNGNSQIVAYEVANQRRTVLAKHDEKTRPNDLVVDNDGGIYYTLTRQNQVMYIPPGGAPVVAVPAIETPNGLTLSPDQKTLYVAAYVPKKILAYSIQSAGILSAGNEFAVMDSGPAKGADGMTTDRAGNIYCAGPKHVWIWSPAGKLLEKIETPSRPINCAFGSPTMNTLFITCFDGVYQQAMKVTGVPPQPGPPTGDSKRPSTKVPDSVTAQLDVKYASYGSRSLLMDVFAPKQLNKKLPAIVVVHGGGWLKGDKAKFRALSIELARRGFVSAAIEYRLGGEAKFPAAIHDCNAAVRFLRANHKTWNIDTQRIGAVGGSAGGHLVGLMATGWDNPKLQGEGGNSAQSSRLQAAIVMAGPMQMTTGQVAERSRNQPERSNANQWLGKTLDEDPELYRLASPYLHVSETSSPILFMVGEHDQPSRNEPTREKLKEHQVWTDVKVYEDGKHGCWNQNPWFDRMVHDMEQFFRAKL